MAFLFFVQLLIGFGRTEALPPQALKPSRPDEVPVLFGSFIWREGPLNLNSLAAPPWLEQVVRTVARRA